MIIVGGWWWYEAVTRPSLCFGDELIKEKITLDLGNKGLKYNFSLKYLSSSYV